MIILKAKEMTNSRERKKLVPNFQVDLLLKRKSSFAPDLNPETLNLYSDALTFEPPP